MNLKYYIYIVIYTLHYIHSIIYCYTYTPYYIHIILYTLQSILRYYVHLYTGTASIIIINQDYSLGSTIQPYPQLFQTV